jgi:Zn-dependent peptidase ImmA (M78 family)
MSVNIKLINSRVNALLKSIPELKLPVDVEAIAKSLGLKVIPYDLGEGVSGLLAIQEGLATIGYNPAEAPVRVRYTIAHEIAHFDLHRDQSDLFVDKQLIYRSQQSGDTPEKQQMEQEANVFASALLMPSNLLRKEVEKAKLDLASDDAIKKLADKFEVSTTAMAIRISSLGLI